MLSDYVSPDDAERDPEWYDLAEQHSRYAVLTRRRDL